MSTADTVNLLLYYAVLVVGPARQLHAEQGVHKLHTHPECDRFHRGHPALGTERYNHLLISIASFPCLCPLAAVQVMMDVVEDWEQGYAHHTV